MIDLKCIFQGVFISKGGLISESFSILQKMCQITILNFSILREEVPNNDLAHFLVVGDKVKHFLRLGHL